jgi:Outer membrane protein beta-barrel domain
MRKRIAGIFLTALLFAWPAYSQSASAPANPWSAEVSVGWDINLSGALFKSGIGTLDGRPTVIEEQSYGDVFGTGVQWRFGGGYMYDERQEFRAALTIQNVSADVVELGTVDARPLFGTFDDYTSVAFDVGYRYHLDELQDGRVRPYVGGTIGLAFISEMDADLAVPELGIVINDANFYDGTTAFAFGVEGGALVGLNDRLDLNVDLGFRYTGGMSDIDPLVGSGLEDINDDSGRWTLPLMVGLRFKF